MKASAQPPKAVILESDAEIAAHAREIYIQAGRSHAMPPGNVTEITPEERELLVAWFESAANGRNRNDAETPARAPALLQARAALSVD